MTDDLISRQAAIDAINHICPVDTEYDCTLLDRVDVRYVLSELPPAQPERKKGKWISLDDFRGKYNTCGYKCSECGEHSDYEENFCPWCGAKMEDNDGN